MNDKSLRELDPRRIEFWLTVNYFFACLVPVQVVARYAYVRFALAHFGSFKPMSLSDWSFLCLGILSLFTALSYSWRNIKVGTVFGTILCVGSMANFVAEAVTFAKNSHLHWSELVIAMSFLAGAFLYAAQLHFIATKFNKGIRDA